MKGRKNRGLNLIDALIILVLLLGAAGMLVRFYMTHRSGADTVAAVHFVIAEADPALFAAMSAGGAFTLESGDPFGEIVKESLQSAPATLYPTDADGKITATPSALFCEIRGEFQVSGRFTEGGFLTESGRLIAPGQAFTVCSRYVETEILPLSVEKI